MPGLKQAWPDIKWLEAIIHIAPAIAEDQEEALHAIAVRFSLGKDDLPYALVNKPMPDPPLQRPKRRELIGYQTNNQTQA